MKKSNPGQDTKPDLKHDTMEYAASTEADDALDMDHETADEIEDEDITADELKILEDDSIDDQAAALNSVETDREADNEVTFDETGPMDEADEGEAAAEELEQPRK